MVGVVLNVWFTMNGMYTMNNEQANNRVIPMWHEQAIIEWSRWNDLDEWPLTMLMNLVNRWLYFLMVLIRALAWRCCRCIILEKIADKTCYLALCYCSAWNVQKPKLPLINANSQSCSGNSLLAACNPLTTSSSLYCTIDQGNQTPAQLSWWTALWRNIR